MTFPNNNGLKYIRMLNNTEIDLVKTTYESIKHKVVRHNEVHWINLFMNNNRMIEYNDTIHDWVLSLIKDNNLPTHIISYGYIINPAHSVRNQDFHYDYTFTATNIFIPLTYVTPSNGTQFITEPLNNTSIDNNYYGDPIKILTEEDVPFIEVKQIMCKPYCMLQLMPKISHRGIANTDDFDRIMFFLTVDKEPYNLREATTYTG
jgi:hypothetical protein